MKDQIKDILASFDLDVAQFRIERINSGHINYTYKLSGRSSFILQRINKSVFTKPEWIAHNHGLAQTYLKENFPDYLFLDTLKTSTGLDLVYDKDDFPWRIFPYIEGSLTVDQVGNAAQAFNAAAAFGALSKKLSPCDPHQFKVIISNFHDLDFRYHQFEDALAKGIAARKVVAASLISKCQEYHFLVERYSKLKASGKLRLRITHNDTKINNVLFASGSNEVLCVIDLDTLMPGYFIYDLGDMVRTFVSPVSEEESDFTKIRVREEVKQAIEEGYLSEMRQVLTKEELEVLSFAGPMMTYMIGMRFLTDYLMGDTYYQISSPDQNLIRAGNQFCLLEHLLTQAHLY